MDNPGYVSNPEMWREKNEAMRSGAPIRPILGVDFDGTCAITHVVKNVADLSARAVYRTAEALREYSDYFDIYVVSARAYCEAGADAIHDALREFGVPDRVLDGICITNCKPPCHLYIDDRCLCFKGKWPPVAELIAFVPWHGKGIRE